MVFIIVWHFITYLFDTRAKKKSPIKHVGTELRTINSLRQYYYYDTHVLFVIHIYLIKLKSRFN